MRDKKSSAPMPEPDDDGDLRLFPPPPPPPPPIPAPSNSDEKSSPPLVDFVRNVPFKRGTLPAWVGTPRCTSFAEISPSWAIRTTIATMPPPPPPTRMRTSARRSSRYRDRHRRSSLVVSHAVDVVVVASLSSRVAVSAGTASTWRTLVGGSQFDRRTERRVVVVDDGRHLRIQTAWQAGGESLVDMDVAPPPRRGKPSRSL